ncbi:MAG TPA: tetratricopeptide repeat protein [Thermoanaerobaculia bacterium]|jgi:tetratricopeptide (TPR) repeat protein
MAVQRDKVIASAEKLVAKGKIEPAIKEYERLLDDNPNDVNTLNRIGDLWVRINRNDEAVKVFVKIADHYSKDGFFLKAIAIYKKINKLDPSKLEIYAKLADLYAKQGLAMEAKSQYQVLADYYLKHGDPGNAVGIYRKISELDPNSINVHVKLADLYSQTNRSADALKEYDRVGRMLLKRGMLDEAVQVFRKALKVDPTNTELVDSLVTALLEAKDFDNATQIVEAGLEGNRENPRLLGSLGRIQLARGDARTARATLERALASDPNEASVREALADLYLKQSEPDRALEMVNPLVEKALGRGERAAAVEMLNRVLRVESGHTPTLERMVAVYTRLNEETNILSSMATLAEAHVSRMNFDEAAKVLERLIQREPQNAQHRNKLQFVKSQMGGIDTMPVRAKTGETPRPPLPAMEIEEPAPSFSDAVSDMGGMDDSITLDLDASEPLELDLSMDIPSTPAPAPVAPPPTHIVSAVEQAAADLADDGQDLDFITEHLTEAEVFAKYGLAEKAAEHLRAVLNRAPKNLTAHERLFRILLEEGDANGARTAAQAYVGVLQEKGDTATIDAVRNEFVARGQSFEPVAAPAKRPPTMERPIAVAAPAPEPVITLDDFVPGGADDEITMDLDSTAEEIEFDLEQPEPVQEPEPVEELTLEPEPEPVAEPEAEPEPVLDLVQKLPEPLPEMIDEPLLDLEQLTEPVIETGPDPLLEEPQPEPAAEPETISFSDLELEPVEELSFGEVALEPEPVVEPEPEPVAASADPFFGAGDFAPEEEDLPLDEVGELDFYIQQELFEEARAKVDTLLMRFPGNGDLIARRMRIEAATAAPPPAAEPPAPAPAAPTPFLPPALSRDDIDSELLSAIPDDDDELPIIPAPAPPPSAAATGAPDFSASAIQEENLFADEEDFFDLAAELESELAEDEEAISLSEEEQSLEEIFKEFKKGVEQQLDSEDYDTHYNLGIAYKEMGLIDEAIGEFQLASKDPKRAVECASMLGLCFLEKGMPQLAIKWYRKGLEMPEITEEEHVGLLYDLGAAYQEVGDTEQAQKAFMEVYGMNSNYRDTVTRIKALEGA